MKIFYTLGIFTATFFLIQIDMLLIMLSYFLFYSLGMTFLSELSCGLTAVIVIIAHFMSTVQSLNHLENKDIDFEKELQERNNKNKFLNHPFYLGFFFRIIKEFQNIKKVVQLKFKDTRNEYDRKN